MSNELFLLGFCFFFFKHAISAENIYPQQQCRCGLKINNERTKRIVGGERARTHEFPWFANIFYQYQYRCGGTIINDFYILTAGHCVSGNPRHMFVITGKLEVIPGNRTNHLPVRYTTVHEHFQSVDHHHDIYDIGLVCLKSKLDFALGKVWPVCLPKYETIISNVMGVVVASEWYNIENYKVGLIKKGSVTMMKTADCKKTSIAHYITGSYNQIICAKSNKDDACQGDSGGPLLKNDTNPVIQAGIISWGVNCAKPNYPGIYTNVKYFLSWIKHHTTGATYCNH